MGLIGRNGAGKSTTIKSVLNLIHSTGQIRYFGSDLMENEAYVKQHIGYACGEVDYYRKKKISSIVKVTRKFFDNWDEDAYEKYLKLFDLNESKTPGELSSGMKVKLNLALALSHGARLLILDEPTSGLDPVSRDELLEIFSYLAREGTAILFSTHITSDLDKCADTITYIRNGQLLYTGGLSDYVQSCRKQGFGSNLEEIMIHFEREALHAKFAL